MKASIIITAIVLIALLGLGIFYFRDTTGPALSLSRAPGPVSAKTELRLGLLDSGTGIKNLTVTAVQAGRTIALLSKQYPPGTREAREKIKLSPQVDLKEGPFKLQVTTTDHSIYRFGAGNSTVRSLDFSYHNKPPAVTVLSTAHNVSRGGAGLVAYTIDREVEKNGVAFADRFYPGYRQAGDVHASLFAFPHDMPADSFVPKVLAIDGAGNERRAGIYYHLLPKSFPGDRIEIGDAYLDKISAEFKDQFPQAASPLEVFLKANRELRDNNARILRECSRKTSPVPLWEGAFLRLPNSAPRGSFAQQRSYFYQGKQVDQQMHLGIDLASLAHAEVPAANRGRVVYADDLGIYGKCVIIDHGLGLQTLYGHLSLIGVKVGEEIQKGQTIGNTGDTGLAGGDHLHFGVVISGEEVNPIEWWDASWVKNNITGKLEAAKKAVPAR